MRLKPSPGLPEGPDEIHNGWLVYFVTGDQHKSTITGDSLIEVRINTQSGGGGGTPESTTTSAPATSSIPSTPAVTTTTGSTPAVTAETTGKGQESPKNITVKSQDEKIKITLPEGTVGLTGNNAPVYEITVNRLPEPPGLPGGAVIAGPVYNLGPEGATFTPALNLSLNYDPADIPSGYNKEKLAIAYWNPLAGEWIIIDSVVHPDAKTVTASVTHFTVFSILAYAENSPPAIYSVKNITLSPEIARIGEKVTAFALVSNDSAGRQSYEVTMKVNGVIEKSQSVTMAAGEITMLGFTLTRDAAGSYLISIGGLDVTLDVIATSALAAPDSTATPTKQFKWTMVYIIAGALSVIIVIVVLIILRRRMD